MWSATFESDGLPESEAAELMEHFQWITAEDSRQLDAQGKIEVGEELADVYVYWVGFFGLIGLWRLVIQHH